MANPFVKAWNYLMALFDSKIEESADPKIQIEQALTEARNQHKELSMQAATVIGNQRQLEMRLNRQIQDVEKIQGNIKQALQLADRARMDGDEQKAREYERAAEHLATDLVSQESMIESSKQLHEQALQQSESARDAVKQNELRLQEKVSQHRQLLSQIEQAKMQEKVNETLNVMHIDNDTASLDRVRDKIEARYAKALGASELHAASGANRMREIEQSMTRSAGSARLAEIRGQMQANKELEM